MRLHEIYSYNSLNAIMAEKNLTTEQAILKILEPITFGSIIQRSKAIATIAEWYYNDCALRDHQHETELAQ